MRYHFVSVMLKMKWSCWRDTVKDITRAVNAYIMNPPYNGSDRANKPWTSIVMDTITHAVPGSEFLFIVPVHWRTNPGKEYTKVRTCLRTQLAFFQEHYVDASTFGVGEEISWWIARKKQDPEDQSVLEEYEYFDEHDTVQLVHAEVVEGRRRRNRHHLYIPQL